MSPHLWTAFLLASLVIGLVPGPGVMNVVGIALGSGRGAALASVAGQAVGNIMATILSLAGVGALLAASALAFSLLKWAGALYLIVLGVGALVGSRTPAQDRAAAGVRRSPRAAFASSAAIGFFHPKTIVFFVAFVPQFITAHGNYLLQASILVATFAAATGCTDTIYALLASRASHLLRRPHTQRWARRASGSVLIAAGVATVAVQD